MFADVCSSHQKLHRQGGGGGVLWNWLNAGGNAVPTWRLRQLTTNSKNKGNR